MKYEEAMRRFGSDKPDLRFEMEIVDLSVILKECGFKVFSGAIANGGIVRAINVKGGAKFSRKEIDALAKFAASYKAKGVAWYKSSDGEISSSYAKFLSDTENEAIKEAVFFEDGDLILIVADREKIVCDTLGALRCHMAKKLGLVKKDEYRMLWVTDFPLFEYDEESGALYAAHNPFTMPVVEDIKYLDTEPLKVNSTAFDIVINGNGSRRRFYANRIIRSSRRKFSELSVFQKNRVQSSVSYGCLQIRRSAARRNGIRFRPTYHPPA